MTLNYPLGARLATIASTIHDGMIVVRRPANNNETAIFWTSSYFLPIGSSEPTELDFEAFLRDLQTHLQYNPAHDHILFRLPTPYELFPLDPALPGVEIPREPEPVNYIVHDYYQWILALVAMQKSRLMQESDIEYVLRDGLVTTSFLHRTHPVAAVQFFLVRVSGILFEKLPNGGGFVSNVAMQAQERELQPNPEESSRPCWTLPYRQRLLN